MMPFFAKDNASASWISDDVVWSTFSFRRRNTQSGTLCLTRERFPLCSSRGDIASRWTHFHIRARPLLNRCRTYSCLFLLTHADRYSYAKSKNWQFFQPIACKQALRMGYSEICFRMARSQKLGGGRDRESLQWSLYAFLRANFFLARFRLFPAPTNCPWVSEDGFEYSRSDSERKLLIG